MISASHSHKCSLPCYVTRGTKLAGDTSRRYSAVERRECASFYPRPPATLRSRPHRKTGRSRPLANFKGRTSVDGIPYFVFYFLSSTAGRDKCARSCCVRIEDRWFPPRRRSLTDVESNRETGKARSRSPPRQILPPRTLSTSDRPSSRRRRAPSVVRRGHELTSPR